MSLGKGMNKSKYLAVAIAVIAIAFGIWFQFFYSRGFVQTTATIVSTQDEGYDSDDTRVYSATVEYTVDGVIYTENLDTLSFSYREGKTVKVRYDPAKPSVVHAASGLGIYTIAAGIVILAALAISGIQRIMYGTH